MADSDLIYIIPPYLLNTCLGLDLHHKLRTANPDLGARNLISSKDPKCYFREPKHLPTRTNSFCDEKEVDAVVRDKVRDKLAVLGVLGAAPPRHVPDAYLHELYEIFKHRLYLNRDRSKDAADDALASHTPRISASPGGKDASKAKRSVFEHPNVGEFGYGPGWHLGLALEIVACPIDILMDWARDSNEHKYSFLPVLMVDDKRTYLSPLPMYWMPLAVDEHFAVLEKALAMLVAFDNGYSTLNFSLQKDALYPEDTTRKKRFYNFIANRPVDKKTGVFYYEVLVEQTTTHAADYRPIIHANDSSLSSTSSLYFSVGYTKRVVHFDKLPTGSAPSSSGLVNVDLGVVQAGLTLYYHEKYNSSIDADTLTFLGAEPGISLEGSLAVSFNNSCSYASVKNYDNNYRTSSLSMNRRFSQLNRLIPGDQETSKLDLEVPLNTHSVLQQQGVNVARTDTVGVGVNFIDNSLFVTVNGILVKVITNEEIVSSNRYKDSIFDHGTDWGSLYPIIGFQLGALPSQLGDDDLSESKIITNFGLKEFKFNINNYVKGIKAKQELQLQTTIEEELQNISSTERARDPDVAAFEDLVCKIKDDQSVLNDFIKGYLIQEGYLDTLGAFETDLVDLAKNTKSSSDEDMEKDVSLNALVERSHAVERLKLRQLVMNHDFLEAIKFLETNYSDLPKCKGFVLELRLLHYIDLLKQYIGVKFGDEFDFPNTSKSREADLFQKAILVGRELYNSTGLSSSTRNAMGEFSSVLLVRSKEELEELPLAKKHLDKFERDVEWLADQMNMAILDARNFSNESRLESMVHSVGLNISDLCRKDDSVFKLINFERDYIDL